jgi:hypothetical protein
MRVPLTMARAPFRAAHDLAVRVHGTAAAGMRRMKSGRESSTTSYSIRFATGRRREGRYSNILHASSK